MDYKEGTQSPAGGRRGNQGRLPEGSDSRLKEEKSSMPLKKSMVMAPRGEGTEGASQSQEATCRWQVWVGDIGAKTGAKPQRAFLN